MPTTIDGYRCKLINKILFAVSQEEVQSCIDEVFKDLQKKNTEEHMIEDFLDKTITTLEEFNVFDCTSNQWSNIHMSKIVFNRIRSSYSLVI